MYRWGQLSLTAKIAAVLAASVLAVLGTAFLLLNRSNTASLAHFAEGSALSILESTHSGLLTSVEAGDMDLLQEMLERSASAGGVTGLRLLAEGRVTDYVSAPETRDWPVPDTVWRHAQATDAPLMIRDPAHLDLYKPEWVTDRCTACHDDWQEGDGGAVIHLRYDQQELQTARQHFALNGMLTMGLTVLLLTVILTFAVRRLVVRPIAGLAETARRIAQQDLSTLASDEDDVLPAAGRPGARSRDEVGALASAFHWMVAQLRQALREARRQSSAAEEAAAHAAAEHADAEARQSYLSDRVDHMLAAMDRFAGGDLTVRLDVRLDAGRDDEIGRLYAGFNHAAAELRGMVERVRCAAERTADTVAQLSTSTEQLSVSVQEQSLQSNEVATAVEQMARTVVDNAQHVRQAAETSAHNRDHARDGGAVVGRTIETIRAAGDASSRTAAAIDRFAERSRAVGSIVETIGDIADQTNLLALNAAIEAARAGEHGRGFAVVADEVRKLAERTTQATREVGGLIRSVQSETAAAVEVVAEGRASADESVALAERAGEALTRIVAATERAEDMIRQIASAAEEQSATSEQIAQSVTTISATTQTSADDLARIAGSLDALDALAGELHALASRFRTETAPATTTAMPQALCGDGGAPGYRTSSMRSTTLPTSP